jgi:hypothetical protein
VSYIPQPRTIIVQHNPHVEERVDLPHLSYEEMIERSPSPPYFLDVLESGTKPCCIEYRWTGTFRYDDGFGFPLYIEHARKYPVDFRELDEPFDPEAAAEAFRKAFNETHAEEKPIREAHPRGVQVYRVPESQYVHGTNCDACGNMIIWIKTKRGKRAALDVRSAITDDGGCTMIDHYSPKVCPAGAIRRKKT